MTDISNVTCVATGVHPETKNLALNERGRYGGTADSCCR